MEYGRQGQVKASLSSDLRLLVESVKERRLGLQTVSIRTACAVFRDAELRRKKDWPYSKR